MNQPAVFSDVIKTQYGVLKLEASVRGLVKVWFPKKTARNHRRAKVPEQAQKWLDQGKTFLKNYFLGQVSARHQLPIDWRVYSCFERTVMKQLTHVQPGETISYGALAALCGTPKAGRAVGRALKRNPIPIIVPCHRVIRKNHSLGGFNGGVRWKRTLLKLDTCQI